MRYLLLDRIDELKTFSYAIGKKAICLAEDCFEHHFPGQPVYPGALLIESMAQLGGALLELSLRDELDFFPRCVMSTVKAKFRDFARPGDALHMRAEIRSRHEESAMVRVQTTRDGERVCEAELLYIYVKLDDPALQASREAFLEVITRNTTWIDADDEAMRV